MRLTAFANHLGEPKARMHRHLSTLRILGYVDQDAQTECYKLSLKLAHIGQAAMDQFDLRRLAEPYMLKLRDLTGQTVVLEHSGERRCAGQRRVREPEPRDHLGAPRATGCPAHAVGAGPADARVFPA
jgi:DNA-binding IclR family transcriptional regulator